MSFNILNRLGGSKLPRLVRSLQDGAALRPAQLRGGRLTTPNDFLKAIGRSSDTKLAVDTWEALWKTGSHDMKKAGLSVRDRRYILWCMEKYRQGWEVKEFAHEARPRKTIRGWGPKTP